MTEKMKTDEKVITYGEVSGGLTKHGVRYAGLLFGRSPEGHDGERIVYVLSDEVDMDCLEAARKEFREGYGIDIQVFASERSQWINRSYAWL